VPFSRNTVKPVLALIFSWWQILGIRVFRPLCQGRSQKLLAAPVIGRFGMRGVFRAPAVRRALCVIVA
jgi:hypothetical protein